MEYRDLKHFELVHGRAFVFLLEQLDKRLGSQLDGLGEGKNEGFDSKKVQLKHSAKQLRETPRAD